MFGFDFPTLLMIAIVTLAAFIVRGLSGFGSSLIGVGALSTVLPPAQVVPTYLALELVTSLNLLPSVWRHVNWRSLRWVVGGSVLATPLGVGLLARLDVDLMRLIVSACLLAIALFMLSGLAARLAPRSAPGALGSLLVGAASGVLNGAAGIGGPPAIVFYFATTAAAVGRATIIAFFLLTNTYVLLLAGGSGLLAEVGWQLIIVAAPFALAGIWIGQHGYSRLDDAALRRLIWRLLVLLGALGLGAAAVRLGV
ncbi:sulfite exporter TauE/SafE family protein [Piscinibacter sakaiensis]|uniref:sulfite exporter TauE/SafE family protein n=1 Tax=Piscinibacter sakaiensis TaxID=1547922 RepID=UPI003AAD1433